MDHDTPWERIGWPLPFPALKRLFDHWIAVRGKRPCPNRDDIDPLALADILPDLTILKVADDGANFLFEFVGARMTSRLGRRLQGMTRREAQIELRDQIDREAQRRLDNEYAWIANSLNGTVRMSDLRAFGRRWVRCVRIALPLSAVMGRAQFVICATSDAPSLRPSAPSFEDGFAINHQTLEPMPLPLEFAPRLA